MAAVPCAASFLITSSFCSVIEHPALFWMTVILFLSYSAPTQPANVRSKMCSLRAKSPLMRARTLAFIEILGVSGLSTLVHAGILAVNIDILLHLSCVQTLT